MSAASPRHATSSAADVKYTLYFEMQSQTCGELPPISMVTRAQTRSFPLLPTWRIQRTANASQPLGGRSRRSRRAMANLSPSMPYTARSSIGVRRRPSPDSEAMARSMLRASMTRPTTAQKQSHSDLTAPPRRNNLPDRHAVFTALPASVNRERQVTVVVSRIALGSCNGPACRRMFTLRMGRKRRPSLGQ